MKNTNIFILLIILTLVSVGSASASTNSHIINDLSPVNMTVSPDRPLTNEDIITITFDIDDPDYGHSIMIGFYDPVTRHTGFNPITLLTADDNTAVEIDMNDINAEGLILYNSSKYKELTILQEFSGTQYEDTILLEMESEEPEEPITPSDGLQSLLLSILAPFIMLFLVLLILKEFELIGDKGGKNK